MNTISGKRFVFTGFRDQELERRIYALGGSVVNSVTYSTTYVVAKNINSDSGKAQKARSYGIKVIDRQALEILLLAQERGTETNDDYMYTPEMKKYFNITKNKARKAQSYEKVLGSQRETKQEDKFNPPKRKLELDII